jgi:hypothetical protein
MLLSVAICYRQLRCIPSVLILVLIVLLQFSFWYSLYSLYSSVLLQLLAQIQGQSQSYFTNGGSPPINSSWRQTLETHGQNFVFNSTPTVIVLI